MSRGPLVQSVETTVHGRFLVRPARGAAAAPLLVGFHGYGENAEALLEQLELIPGAASWHLAAIQALHRFYNGKTGDVVACWMTKQDRRLAIDDNVRYVAKVIDRLRGELATGEPLVYVGFSQGTAMAYRAAAAAGKPCGGLIALGGDVPPELAEAVFDDSPPVLIGRGQADEWYSEERLGEDLGLLRRKGLEVEVCRFVGGHEWTDEFRSCCGRFLDRVRLGK